MQEFSPWQKGRRGCLLLLQAACRGAFSSGKALGAAMCLSPNYTGLSLLSLAVHLDIEM